MEPCYDRYFITGYTTTPRPRWRGMAPVIGGGLGGENTGGMARKDYFPLRWASSWWWGGGGGGRGGLLRALMGRGSCSRMGLCRCRRSWGPGV